MNSARLEFASIVDRPLYTGIPGTPTIEVFVHGVPAGFYLKKIFFMYSEIKKL